MLIVGGTAALTAIATYLVLYYTRQLLIRWRKRRLATNPAIGDARHEAQARREIRELDPVP